MNYKLIVTDLDGTLLTPEMNVSRENTEAINKISDAGITFAVSSGRTLYEIPDDVLSNPNIRYLTYSNGSAIYDKKLGQDIYSSKIRNEDVKAAIDIINDYDVFTSTHVSGRAYINKGSITKQTCERYQINEYYYRIFLESNTTDNVKQLALSGDETEAIVLFFASDDEMVECKARLEGIEGITVTSSVAHNIEFCPANAGKGKALAKLAEILGIKKEEIISIGDNMNDTSMFEVSGLALCAGNGSDEAKALADAVICKNTEHVAEYALKNYLNK